MSTAPFCRSGFTPDEFPPAPSGINPDLHKSLPADSYTPDPRPQTLSPIALLLASAFGRGRALRSSALLSLAGAALLALGFASVSAQSTAPSTPWTDTQYPSYIRRLNFFGERPDWSHDGKKILFVGRSFGDVYEIEVATGTITPVTHHYYHGGYLRAHYLANGDILLLGPKKFDPTDWRDARFKKMELWVLDKSHTKPPVALGEFLWEGPAVSRTELKISWAKYPDQKGLRQLMLADLDYSSGQPKLINQRVILDNTREEVKDTVLEPQNFIPGRPDELTVQVGAWKRPDMKGAEVFTLNFQTGELINQSKTPFVYDEVEGIFPDGKNTLVECAAHDPDPKTRTSTDTIELYKLSLDNKQTWERLTWFSSERRFKASNPVVSDDGKYIAFMVAHSHEVAGIGHGIYLLDLTAHAQATKK